MDKGAPSSLFVNDGSFMERFKQLQQGTDKGKDKKEAASFEESKPPKVITGASLPKPAIVKTTVEPKANDTRKTNQPPTGGKLAFSLKQKSKLVAPPVKLAADDDEDEKDAGKGSDDTPVKRQKLGQSAYEQSSNQVDVAPSSPSDPTVKKVADKLASFVAKHGRQFEHVTRQKNPGDTPFKFLFDESCADYKYYEYRLAEEERALSQNKESQTPRSDGINASAFKSPSGSQRPVNKQSSYQIPASALYDSAEDPRVSLSSVERTGSSNGPTSADPLAMMEFYMKKAAQEEKTRQPKQSKDEMPPPASLQAPPAKRGHHMGDYIPPEELEKFLAACNDAASQKAVQEIAHKTKIQSDNVGHKLLSKMGWKEGEGLGSSKNGISDPIMAGGVKKNNLGVGAHQPGEVTPDDDIYEQYKKRMMLGYKHRPNPLNNPRKAYY